MALPININELLTGKTVEWERIEFREGWNPERKLRTMCAFANDFNNWGGGYIILGVEESKGLPVLPPKGLDINSLDSIQQELNQICRKILPNYFPLVEPVEFQGKNVLVLWCPGGSYRPYKAPDSLGKTPRYFYYIRRFSSTVRPKQDEERELISMSNRVPFDDQVNHSARLSDFDLASIKVYLNEVKSDLEHQIPIIPMDALARRMNIAEGPDEYLLPKNVGLLFFANDPQRFFPQAKIEIVTFADESGTDYTEKIFTGQIHNQLKGALRYINDQIIVEKIHKISGRAEADRFYNYPFDAIEEALCNAVYHRGYDNDSTIEVRIYPSRIEIISFPGPLPPLDKESLETYSFKVRKYRNRRIGDFLKELHLTEGRSTGIPKMLKSIAKNGSPKPIFETDKERLYFKTTFFIHEDFLLYKKSKDELSTNLEEIDHAITTQEARKFQASATQVKVIRFCKSPRSRMEIHDHLNMRNRKYVQSEILKPLLEQELIALIFPDKPQSPKQKYITTEKGDKLLEVIINN